MKIIQGKGIGFIDEDEPQIEQNKETSNYKKIIKVDDLLNIFIRLAQR
jgi:hypothetical protein